jgi:thioredoxin-related protein
MNLLLNYKRISLLLIIALGFTFLSFRPGNKDEGGIKWMSFTEAIKENKAHPKKIFIDVYTSWCGWCKRMDASTYTDPDIIKYMNKNFYAVRLDAETTDTFHFNNHDFKKIGSTNELASSLLDGKMMYPTTVYLDEQVNRLSVAPGYLSAGDLKPVLMYFGENKYKTMKFDDYKKSLDSKTAGSN